MLFGAGRRRNVHNFVVLKNVPNTGTRIELAAVSIVRDFSFELTGSKGSVGRITSHLGEDTDVYPLWEVWTIVTDSCL